MKINNIKILSPMDKINNLMYLIEKNQKPNYDKKINLIGSEFTLRELRSIYKEALKTLSHDKFEKTSK